MASFDQRLREQPGSFRRHPTLSSNQLIDSLNRNTNVRGESDLGLPMWSKKLLQEDLSGVRRTTRFGLHDSSSMVVEKLSLVSCPFPPLKYDPPLLVHANAMETCEVSSKCF